MDDCGPHCRETLQDLERFLDDELTVTVRAQIERHIRDCHPCAERTEFQRHLKLLIATKCGREQVPAELRDKILRLIREAEHERIV
jgi:mycothiol system anti-sigma-R factor